MLEHPVIRDTFSEPCTIFSMLKNLWWRDTGHVGTLSLGYWGAPWRQVLRYKQKMLMKLTIWKSRFFFLFVRGGGGPSKGKVFFSQGTLKQESEKLCRLDRVSTQTKLLHNCLIFSVWSRCDQNFNYCQDKK